MISIVIPTYNRCDELLKPCLESIKKYTDPSKIEVIVVANGCKDNTREYVESLGTPFKLIWLEEPSGYTKSTNEGIKAATGEYIVLLNNDTVLLEQQKDTWLKILIEPFKDPTVGITGPLKAYCPYARKDFLIFFCVMMKKEMFDKYGLLDEIFNPGFGEDVEWCVRIINQGYRIQQVPVESEVTQGDKLMLGQFPIFHVGEGTFAHTTYGDKLLAERRFLLMNRFHTDIKLNLGCGNKPLKGYFNVDIGSESCDIAWDVRTIPLDDNKVEEIISAHLFEHLSNHEVRNVLKEWRRVLKPGGRLILEMPNIEGLCKLFTESKSKEDRYMLLVCIYGTTFPQYPHRFGWYPETLADLLRDSGFEEIQSLPPQFDHWGSNFRTEAVKSVNLPNGFFSNVDIVTYRKLMRNVPIGGRVAELGSWKGRSLCSVADIIKDRNLQVVSVDTFAGTSGDSERDGASREEAKRVNIKEVFKRNMDVFGISPEILHMTTHEASSKFEDYNFDLVYVDADHAYGRIKDDLVDWWPKVKRGGVLAGHDTTWPEVQKALSEEFGHLVSVDYVNSWWVDRPKVYDCFPFCNELDQLEIRLNELDKEVDYFILVEGTETHSGLTKSLHFDENKERFEKFLPKIIHIVVDRWPEYIKGDTNSSWVRERMQRDAAMEGIKKAKDTDILVVGDADEIINPEVLRNYKRHMGICSLEMSLYCYFLNYELKDSKWTESKIIPVSIFRENNLKLSDTRYIIQAMSGGIPRFEKKTVIPIIPNAGWHFSYQGGVDEVMRKICSFSHQEFNRPDIVNRERIVNLIKDGKDLYGRDHINYKMVSIDSTFPSYIVNNMNKFSTSIGVVR